MIMTEEMILTKNAELAHGTVQTCGEEYVVFSGGGAHSVKLSASCVVVPEEGDTVLLTTGEQGGFIISVLEKADKSSPLRIGSEGAVEMFSGESLNICAPDISNTADNFSITAATATIFAKTLSTLAEFISTQAGRIKHTAQSAEGLFKRYILRCETSHKYTADHDEEQTASKRIMVDGVLNIHTESTLHTAEEHIKLDGEQVHLG